MRNIDTESVGAMVGPESEDVFELLVNIVVLPIEIRLLLGEDVQIPLPVFNLFPGGAAKKRHPVIGREFPFFASSLAEYVSIALGRSGAGFQRLLEPLMFVGSMVWHDIHHDLEAGLVGRFNHGIKILHGA